SSNWRSGMRRVTCGWPRAMTGRWVSTATTVSSSTAKNGPTSSGPASRCTAWCADGSVLLLSRGRLLLGSLALISRFALTGAFLRGRLLGLVGGLLVGGLLRGVSFIHDGAVPLGLRLADVGGFRVGLVRRFLGSLGACFLGAVAGSFDRGFGLIGPVGSARLCQLGSLGHLARSQQDAQFVQVPGDGLALLVQLIDMPLSRAPFPVQLGGGIRTQPVGGLPRLPGDPVGALARVAEDLLGLGLGLGTQFLGLLQRLGHPGFGVLGVRLRRGD